MQGYIQPEEMGEGEASSEGVVVILAREEPGELLEYPLHSVLLDIQDLIQCLILLS